MRKSIIPIILIAVVVSIGLVFLSLQLKTPEKTLRSTPIARAQVRVGKDGFSPQSLTIKKGKTVVWINQSGESVAVNSNPHPTHNLHRFLNLGEFPQGSSVQATFEETGTYSYHNHLNPSQTGTVVVE